MSSQSPSPPIEPANKEDTLIVLRRQALRQFAKEFGVDMQRFDQSATDLVSMNRIQALVERRLREIHPQARLQTLPELSTAIETVLGITIGEFRILFDTLPIRYRSYLNGLFLTLPDNRHYLLFPRFSSTDSDENVALKRMESEVEKIYLSLRSNLEIEHLPYDDVVEAHGASVSLAYRVPISRRPTTE